LKLIGAHAMSTCNDFRTKSENLLQQLRGLKFIMDANRGILNRNPVSNEFLNFKVDIAQNFIEELQLWEELGNQSKCNVVFDNAQFFLEQSQVLMDRMLDDYCKNAWLDFQKELTFTNHAFSNYVYVLSSNVQDCPSCSLVN